MRFTTISINHRTADVVLKEQVAFRDGVLRIIHEDLYETKSVLENVILPTYNRTEVYAVVDQIHTGRCYIQRFLACAFEFKVDDIRTMSEVKVGDEAVEHLLRITSGLGLIVLGETQILGQIRDTFFLAQSTGTTGIIFNYLLRQAITFTKRVHNETDITDNAVSVPCTTVELAKRVSDKLKSKQAIIIGTEEMSGLSLLNLLGSGIIDITAINRTIESAMKLATKHQMRHDELPSLPNLPESVDTVIGSASAQSYIITNEMIKRITRNRE